MISGNSSNKNKSRPYAKLLLLLAGLFLLSLIYSSCSSRPKDIQSPAVSQADNLYRMGKQFSRNQDYHNALRSYNLALDRYLLVDNIEGIVLSKIAVIGALAQMRDHESVHVKSGKLEGFIKTNAPEYEPYLTLMKVETAFLAHNYYRVNMLSENFSCDDIIIESQVISYRLISRINEGHSAGSEYRRLRRNAKRLRRAYRRRRLQEIGVYSYVKYVMGFYQVSRENWDRAEELFRISLAVDREIDYSYGIAKNLYYLGHIYKNKGRMDLAEPYYKRALTIFELLEDQINIDIIRSSLAQIEEKKGDLISE